MTKLTFKTHNGRDATITGWQPGDTQYPLRGCIDGMPAYAWTWHGLIFGPYKRTSEDLIITTEEVYAIRRHFTKGRKKARIAELKAQVVELQARLRQVAGDVK